MELPWELQVRLKELENISPSHTRLIYRHRELERRLEEIRETPEYDTVGRAITATRRIEAIQHVLTLSLAAMDLEVFTDSSKKRLMIANQRDHVWKAVGERVVRLKKGRAMMAQEREKISGNGRDFDQFEAEFVMTNVTLTEKLLVIEKMARGLPVEGMWLEKKGYAADAERGFTEWAAKFGNATIPE